jgi:hypothetical protein
MDGDNDMTLRLCEKFCQALLAISEGNVPDEPLDPPFAGSKNMAEHSTLHSAQVANTLAIV